MKRVGVLTGGGDAPGLNAAIKSLVYKLDDHGIAVTAIHNGWSGLLSENLHEAQPLTRAMVRAWDRDGGTRIGSSRVNPFSHKEKGGHKIDRSGEVVKNIERLELDALVTMGGEDTLGVSARLSKKGVPVVGVPKTIDLDLRGTDYTIGFYTALRNCAETIERARTPAGSHHWVQIIEVMGRHAGHLALWSGVAGSAQLILIPESPFSYVRLIERLEERLAKKTVDVNERLPQYAVIVVAEGATATGEDIVVQDRKNDDFGHMLLGGIANVIAARLRKDTPWEARAAVLGHPQRGGPPAYIDRIMANLFGTAAALAVIAQKFGQMVSAKGLVPACQMTTVSLEEVAGGLNLIDVDKWYDTHLYHLKREARPGFVL